MLTKIKVADYIERLVDHAVEGHLTGDELAAAVHKRYLEVQLDMNRGNQTKTAQAIGRHRNSLRMDMQRYGIPPIVRISKRGRRSK